MLGNTWRHVAFVEEFPKDGRRQDRRWLFMSDVCKHCENAGCLDACPTGAIVRTEFGSVVIQQDVCNGCEYCVPSCPFGVITTTKEADGLAHKCTLCYDRLKVGLEPACAKACPTDSIIFGPVSELRERARQRVEELHAQGMTEAYLYGVPGGPGATGGIKGLNCFFLLTERPEAYNLPAAPEVPTKRVWPSFLTSVVAALGWGLATVVAIRAINPTQK
ncbi:MAG: 4Fe-4S dicluster domain-containing protein [Chloroflexota bacterium]